MESKTASQATVQPVTLGEFEVALLLDPVGTDRATVTNVRQTADNVAREVPLVIGALLLTQRAMRATTDPRRLATVAEIEETCKLAREKSPKQPQAPANARTIATYRVKLTGAGGFRIDVDEKLAGISQADATASSVTALAVELLASLQEPYRTFFREMLEAAVVGWTERRPLLTESTWAWPTALQRLNHLVRQGSEQQGERQVCSACQAWRPAGFNCLHCGMAPGAMQTAAPQQRPETRGEPYSYNSSASAAEREAPSSTDPAQPAAERPVPATEAMSGISSPSPASYAPSVDTAESDELPHTIVRAQEISPAFVPDETPVAPPKAGIFRRVAATVVDVVAALIIGSLASFGLTTILMASGSFGPTDSPQQFSSALVVILVALYFVAGWTTGGTYGMMLFRLHLVRTSDYGSAGLLPALGRVVGYVALVALAAGIFVVGNLIDNQLIFIQGTADTAVRIIIGLVSLYVIWLGSGQLILTRSARQTWGDRLGGVLVATGTSK